MPKVVRQSGPAPTPKKVAKKVESEDPWERISPIGFDESKGLKMLLYGASGTGKTRIWSTFPGPILGVIASSLRNPGETLSIDTPENRKKISQVTVRKIAEVLTLVEKQRETERFKTVVLDHASGLLDFAMKEVLGIEEMPAQLSWGVASMQQWGEGGGNCREILRSLLNLDCNVVIVAQERDFSKKEGESPSAADMMFPTISAGLIPSLTGWLVPCCNYVCQTFKRNEMKDVVTEINGEEMVEQVPTGKVEYCARTGAHSVVTTKFRVPPSVKLPDVIVNPDYSKFLKLIKGS
jgi:hypothetical protein